MSARWFAFLFVAVAACLLAGCSEPPTFPAEVQLKIDSKSYDYRTSKAQYDDKIGEQGYSVYLLPENEQSGEPYVAMRTYSGNPVTRLWIRYIKPERIAEGIGDLDRYQCFVPGVLADGRQTLGWKKQDGSKRHASETGEENCEASITRKGDELRFTFDAVVKRKKSAGKKKRQGKKAEQAKGSEDTVKIDGKAVINLSK